MSKTKTKFSTAKVYYKSKRTGKWLVYGYLSRRDEENGRDIRLDKLGYKVVAL